MVEPRDVARVDIQVSVGSSFVELYRLTDDSNAQIDLTGWVAVCQIRRRPSEASPVLATPVATVPNELGEFTVSISAAVTRLLEPNPEGESYFWQIDLVGPSVPERFIEGRCTVYPSVIH